MSETSNNDKNNTTTNSQTEQRQHETTTNATNTPTEVSGASSQPSSSATTKSTTIPAETQQAIANIATAIQSTPPVPVNTAPVKLFVGQIPKGLDENGLMPLFRAFGNIVEVKVIRDKMTGESKGCCFVNFERREDAEQCIAKLHNKHTLPPVANPMQVSYADQPVTAAASSSRTQDVKLFVGQLPKDQPDHVLRPIFEPFGDIEEFKVLRDYSGQSKGCGFVRYNNRDSAIAAIRTLDQQYKIGNLTLQVRFAESSRSNNTSRMPMTYGGYSQTSAYMAQPYGHYGAAAAQPVQYDASGAYSASPYGAHLMSSATGAANPYGGGAGGYGTGAYQPGQVPIPKQTQGPPGANLFIMQIPREWRDESLRAAFAPFGNVLSTRVFIDKMTGASKCFGFVSYDNADSAKNAINTMNGFAVGGRQLQVSLKRENR